jgi:hypothetical protein
MSSLKKLNIDRDSKFLVYSFLPLTDIFILFEHNIPLRNKLVKNIIKRTLNTDEDDIIDEIMNDINIIPYFILDDIKLTLPYLNDRRSDFSYGQYKTLIDFILAQGIIPSSNAITWAAANGYMDMIEKLLEYDIRPNSDAINFAGANNQIDFLTFMFDYYFLTVNKSPKWKFRDGLEVTPHTLELAAANGNTRMVEFLLEKGVKPTQDAVDLARLNGHSDIANYLDRILVG